MRGRGLGGLLLEDLVQREAGLDLRLPAVAEVADDLGEAGRAPVVLVERGHDLGLRVEHLVLLERAVVHDHGVVLADLEGDVGLLTVGEGGQVGAAREGHHLVGLELEHTVVRDGGEELVRVDGDELAVLDEPGLLTGRLEALDPVDLAEVHLVAVLHHREQRLDVAVVELADRRQVARRHLGVGVDVLAELAVGDLVADHVAEADLGRGERDGEAVDLPLEDLVELEVVVLDRPVLVALGDGELVAVRLDGEAREGLGVRVVVRLGLVGRGVGAEGEEEEQEDSKRAERHNTRDTHGGVCHSPAGTMPSGSEPTQYA